MIRRRNKGFAGFMLLVLLSFFIVMELLKNQGLNLTWGKFKFGDKVYADNSLLNKKTNQYVPIWTYRRIRPINADDIKQMDIEEWQKLKFITQLDTSKLQMSEMIRSEISIGQDSVFKYKTTCLGTYLKSDSISAEYYVDGSGHEENWYAIKINKAIATVALDEFELPANRTYADDYYYIDAHDARLKEAAIFKRMQVK
jgi:hypothetical protein